MSANIADNPQKPQSGRRKPPAYLTARERDRLLALIFDPRDKAIVTLFCFAGLRLNELRMLDRDDVDFVERTVLVRFAKRGKWRKLRLHPTAEETLAAYLASRQDREPALFLSQRRQRLAPRTIEVMLDRYTTQLALPKHITPHCLRHTFATALYRQCGDLQIVQRALGHADIATTTIYAALEDNQLYGAMDRL